jgi:hypothetical protein
MKPDFLKNFNGFTASVVIFLMMALFCGYVYYESSSPLQPIVGKDAVTVEVSLPVLEWTKYTELSKKLNISSNVKVRRTAVENRLQDDELKPYR